MPDEIDHLTRALAGRYAVGGVLGRGGMATVYLAHDLKHDRQVAIKVLRPELSTELGPERFLREISVTARLEHAHILPLLDSGDAGGLLYYVMPFVQGESLRARLSREKQLPLDDALRIAREVAEALAHAHQHGVMHRDVKPDNILLADGHARVMDFGVARAISTSAEQALTSTGFAVGTPTYMSPEQAAGERDLDARTDVYALGCVLYEMLVGQPPFTGATPHAVLARQAVDPVPSVRVVRDTVPIGVERAIMRALAKVPADRFESAAEFADALDHGRTESAGRAPSTRRDRRRRLFIAAAAVTLIVTPAVWYGLVRRSPPLPISSLAVLPFDGRTSDPTQQHFVDAMHDAVIGELAQIRALTVMSRQSVLRYRGTDESVAEIARELNVDAVVEALVFRVGDSVRITVRVLRARPTERQLWAGSLDGDVRNVLTLQGDVARLVAERVEVAITPDERTRLARERPVDPDAYQAWLRGWVAAQSQSSGASADRCVASAKAAAAIDSAYAPAHALAAYCYTMRAYVTETPSGAVFPHAKASAERAIRLDPSLASAHSMLASERWLYEWDWAGADREFKRAMELAPSEGATQWQYGFFLAGLDRFDEAIEHARRAERLSPGGAAERQNLAMVYWLARRHDDAIAQAQRTIDLAPEFGFAHHRLALAYESKGMYQEAVAAAEKASALVGSGDLRRRAYLARSYALAGRTDDARRILAEFLKQRGTVYVAPTAIAHIYIGLGRLDEAVDWLEKAYDERDADLPLLRMPSFDPLRAHPRYQRLVARMNFPA